MGVEVMKVLRAKKYAKMKKNQSDSGDKSQIDQERKSSNCEEETEKPELEKKSPVRTLQLVNDYPYEVFMCFMGILTHPHPHPHPHPNFSS